MGRDMQHLGWNLQPIDNRLLGRLTVEGRLIDLLTIHFCCDELPLALSSWQWQEIQTPKTTARTAKRLAAQRLVGRHQTYFSRVRFIG